jgi:PAS domain S-box-containing protein
MTAEELGLVTKRYSTMTGAGSASELENIKYALDQSSIIAITDRNGIITYVNDKFLQISGYSEHELVGKTHRIINSGHHQKDFFRELWSTIRTGKVWKGEIRNRTKDGKYYWVDTVIVPITDKTGEISEYISIRHDISELKDQQEKLKFLDEAGMLLSSSIDYESALQSVASLAVPYLADWCIVDIANEEGQLIRLANAHSDPEKTITATESSLKYLSQKEFDYGIDAVYRSGIPVLVPHVTDEMIRNASKTTLLYRKLKSYSISSTITAPLSARDQIFGTIMLVSSESGRQYTQQDLQFAVEIGRRAGAAIDNARLLQSLNKQIRVQKKYEKALRKSEEKYRFLAESIPLIIFVSDPDGRIEYLNGKWVEYTGAKGIDRASRKNAVHPDDYERVTKKWQDSLKSGDEFFDEYRLMHALDRQYRWNRVNAVPTRNDEGVIVNWIGTIIDIHDQKMAAHALEESEKRFRLMADSAPVMIWMVDAQDNTYYFNKVWLEFTGKTLEEEIGKGWMEDIHPDDIAKGDAIFQESFAKRKMFTMQYRVRRRDGVYRWVYDTGTPLYNAENQFNGYIGSVIDITEQREDQERLQASLHEKEVLLKEIHHRVKNNLQIITSLLNLQSKKIKDRQSLAMFAESQNRVKSMALVHENLYRSTNIAKLSFAEYIRSLSSQLFRSYGISSSHIRLTISIQEEVYMDIDMAIPCGLIINELVSNSLKYAFPQNATGEISIALRKSGDKHILQVKDNGVGLPNDFDMELLSSLGLMLVQTLTEQLGGSLIIENQCGLAYTITF